MKKKILIVDPLSYSGHVNYNHGIIRAISKNFDYNIIINKIIADELINRGVDESHILFSFPNNWNVEYLSKHMCKYLFHLVYRFYFLKVLLSVLKYYRQYDAILITCIDVYAFSFVSWLFGGKTYVVDHGIGEVNDNYIYRSAWRSINDKINIVVLEGFIKDMVLHFLPRKKIHVIRHPLPPCPRCNCIVANDDNCLIFAPSSSNYEKFLEGLKEIQVPKNIKVIAKSNLFESKSDIVTIYRRKLSATDYSQYLSCSDYILLAYDPSYNYRISAVLFEAIVLGKKVLLLANNTLQYYGDVFKEGVILFSNNDELLEILKNCSPQKVSYSNIALYSDDKIASCIERIIG